MRTARVRLGERELFHAGAEVAWSVLGNTAQAQLDPGAGLVEHHELHGDGAELAWVLRERPATRDDLVVELAVDGLAFAGQTDGGVHYADAAGTPRVRIGTAELVDADGERWPVVTELEDGQPRWRVSAETLAIAHYPLALDPTVSAEFGLDNPVPGEGTSQTNPAIAGNGGGYLVVWQDDRDTVTHIYGSRVSTAGVVSDPLGFPIASATGNATNPAVASNGTDYLVAWQDDRNGSSTDIYGTRVTATGLVTDGAATGLALSTATGYQQNPAVASNGTDYLVAWDDYRNGSYSDIYGTRVTAAGVVTDGAAAGLALSTATNHQTGPAVASTGTDYLVVWADYRSGTFPDIYGTRVTSAGAVTDDAAIGLALSTATNFQIAPAIASNGTDYLVAWQDFRAGLAWDVYGTRVAADGTVTDGAATGLALSTATNAQMNVAVASDGTDYLVAWMDLRSGTFDIYGTRVTAAGAVTDDAAVGLPLSTATSDQDNPTVASDGTDYLVAWQDLRVGVAWDLYGTRVTAAGVVTDGAATGFALARGPESRRDPRGGRELVRVPGRLDGVPQLRRELAGHLRRPDLPRGSDPRPVRPRAVHRDRRTAEPRGRFQRHRLPGGLAGLP